MRPGPAAAAALAVLLPLRALRAQQDSVRPGPALEPIAVQAAARGADAVFSVSVIEWWDAGRARAMLGLDEVLAGVPGVSAQKRYTYALDTRVVIRGFGARSAFGVRGVTLILDGVPQTMPDGQGQLTNIDIGTIDRAEVVRGAAAAFYGNAAGGVVTMESAPLFGVRRAAHADVVTGSFGLTRLSAGVRAPLGPERPGRGGLALDLAEVHQRGYRDHSASDLTQAALAAGVPLGPGTQLVARLRFADLPRAENPGALTLAELGTGPAAASARNVAMHAGKRVRQWQGSVGLDRGSERGRTAAIVYAVRRDLDNPLASSWVTLDRTDWGARLAAERALDARRRLTLLAGADFQRMSDLRRNYDNLAGRRGDTLRVAQQEIVTAMGARVAMAAQPDARTVLLGGLRYDRVGFRVRDQFLADGDESGARMMDAVSFTAGVSRRLTRALAIRASVGSAFETPTTTELANPGAGGLNGGLSPQQAVQWELGASLAPEAAPFSVTIALFQAAVRGGLLPYEVAAAPGRFVFRNTGRSRHRGAEVALRWRTFPWLEQRAALALTDARFLAYPTDTAALDGKRIPGVPRGTADWMWTVRPRADVRVVVEWTAAGRTAANDANTVAAAAWQTTGVRASWRLGGLRRRAELVAGVNNVFDARYAGSVNVNGAAARYFEPSPGRNWYAGIESGTDW